MKINDPDLIARLTTWHDAYEKALADHDVEALGQFFWDTPETVRYGLFEQSYGADAIQEFRKGSTPAFTERRIIRREICTFGDDFATVMCEAAVIVAGEARPNRQSQSLVNIPGKGWRIVAAHVSAPLQPNPPWGPYVEYTARVLKTSIPPAQLGGVAATLGRSATIAAPLMALQLPDEAESAAVFTA
jgi:hypothetical protein